MEEQLLIDNKFSYKYKVKNISNAVFVAVTHRAKSYLAKQSSLQVNKVCNIDFTVMVDIANELFGFHSSCCGRCSL